MRRKSLFFCFSRAYLRSRWGVRRCFWKDYCQRGCCILFSVLRSTLRRTQATAHCTLHTQSSTQPRDNLVSLSLSRKHRSSVIEDRRRHFQEVKKLLSASQTEHQVRNPAAYTAIPHVEFLRRAWRTKYNSRFTTCQGAWPRPCPWPFSGSRLTVRSLGIQCSKGSWTMEYLWPSTYDIITDTINTAIHRCPYDMYVSYDDRTIYVQVSGAVQG